MSSDSIIRIMPTHGNTLKTLAFFACLAASGLLCAQGDDPWYGGRRAGFWGLSDSVGVRGALPGMLTPPGTNVESLNAWRQFGGYRVSNGFAIEGSQTQFSSSSTSCNGDVGAESSRNCLGSAWSLAGVATLPIQSGFSVHGKLGLHYWQRGFAEDSIMHRSSDEPGGIGKVYGIGLSYDITKAITLYAESERYSELMSNSPAGPGSSLGLDSSVHSIGLSIKF